jgi:hypothetical protein
MIAARHAAAIFLLAPVFRAAFVFWAPGVVSGDDLWHNARCETLANGAGYIDVDGSPSIVWMPGWSLLLAGLYALFGAHLALGFAANVVLGALTALGVAVLVARLLSPGAGLVTGVLYAV